MVYDRCTINPRNVTTCLGLTVLRSCIINHHTRAAWECKSACNYRRVNGNTVSAETPACTLSSSPCNKPASATPSHMHQSLVYIRSSSTDRVAIYACQSICVSVSHRAQQRSRAAAGFSYSGYAAVRSPADRAPVRSVVVAATIGCHRRLAVLTGLVQPDVTPPAFTAVAVEPSCAGVDPARSQVEVRVTAALSEPSKVCTAIANDAARDDATSAGAPAPAGTALSQPS